MVAILLGEPEAEEFRELVARSADSRMSVMSLLETTIVLEGREGSPGASAIDDLVADLDIQLLPVSLDHIEAARQAWRRFGRGNHPAKLNFGDCVVYGLAATLDEPVLFKGDDFALTDIRSA
ncbi:MAG: type II toxin-antitoxin system VapC family toxin [Chloroflexi bacterium]|nr:type II toxin-antitoxin system VapC family toxin [Chloroflexota bacterium]